MHTVTAVIKKSNFSEKEKKAMKARAEEAFSVIREVEEQLARIQALRGISRNVSYHLYQKRDSLLMALEISDAKAISDKLPLFFKKMTPAKMAEAVLPKLRKITH